MIKDVVCGMVVRENKDSIESVYKGMSYFFCSPACRDAFEKSPERYAGKSRTPQTAD